jgi:two-component system CheB/CheR fusion protein
MPQYSNHTRLRDAAFELSPDPQLVVDAGGVLAAANATARQVFTLSHADIGSPLQDLDVSYRPAELRTLIDRARLERREVTHRAVPWEQNGAIRFFDVLVVPLYDDDRMLLGTRISFTDVTPLKSLQDELSHSKQELETAYEELQSTNEELETTNEELQSTVEELETTNEELETMNAELQSTNEELQTMNDELRNRSTDLNSSNAFLEAVFTSLQSAVVVLDRDLRIQVWNAGALDLWGVRAEEAQGSSLFSLDIGLPVGDLRQPIRDVVSGAAPRREMTVPATNRRGKAIRCRISIAPLTGSDKVLTGVILLMEEEAIT